MARKKHRTETVSAESFDRLIGKIGGQRKNQALTDKQTNKCGFCGHDGGKEVVAKQAPVVGITGWACISIAACSHRMKVRAEDARKNGTGEMGFSR